jgi:hypothetical protein
MYYMQVVEDRRLGQPDTALAILVRMTTIPFTSLRALAKRLLAAFGVGR